MIMKRMNEAITQPRPAFFFDRDGIINKRLVGDYVRSIAQFEFIEEFFPFYTKVKQSKYLTFIVTNQQGIGKRLMTAMELAEIHQHLQTELERRTGDRFDDIYYCPDLASKTNSCRKPSPSMLLQAAKEWNITLESSWLIGDMESDVIAGKKAGVSTIRIDFGNSAGNSVADYVFQDMGAACNALDRLLTP